MQPILIFAACTLAAGPFTLAATPATEFLRFIYGAEDVKIEQVCVPNPDLWMLAGPKNENGLKEITELKLNPGRNEIIWETVDNGLCIVEMKEGKADARFILDQVSIRHRQAALRFVYHSLRHDRKSLAEVATHPQKVRFGRTKPANAGDLDVYEELIARLPVVRISAPADDQTSKSITYLLPLGPDGLKVRLIKHERTWKVDTSKGVDVPLEVFYAESKERRVVYPGR